MVAFVRSGAPPYVSSPRSIVRVHAAPPTLLPPGSASVVVAGATGGVGQLVVAKLLARGYHVHAWSRDADRARAMFTTKLSAEQSARLALHTVDARDPSTVQAALTSPSTSTSSTSTTTSSDLPPIGAMICTTGTTAFPSARWAPDGENGPKPTDLDGPRHIIEQSTSLNLSRFVFVTSCGVDRFEEWGPFKLLNAFGVLRYKKQSEDLLRASGLPWTIVRPSRLTDGPYTSYDLNTLLKATSGGKRKVVVSGRDDLGRGQCSRVAVAEACVQALGCEEALFKAVAMETVEGEGPGEDEGKWRELFGGVETLLLP